MNNVYISEPLTGVPNVDDVKAFMELIQQLLLRYGIQCYVPHLNSDPIRHSHLSPEEVNKLDEGHLAQSDLVLLNASIPSHGVGMEAEMAHRFGISIVLLYENEVKVSRMLRGVPAVWFEVRGKDQAEILVNLEHSLIEYGVFTKEGMSEA